MVETAILKKLMATSMAIYEAESRDDLLGVLGNACVQLGYEQFLLSCGASTKRDVIINATLTTFPDVFRHDYDRLNWVEGDIYTDRARETEDTFFWNCNNEWYPDQRNQGYMDFLKSSPITNGVIAPIQRTSGSVSIFAMASSKSVLPTPQNALAVTILSTFAIAKAETLGLSPSISADEASALRSLSPPQREILKWVAAGKSNFDIATILGLPERTVRYHVSEILRKLGVVSRSQAVVIGKSGKVV